MKEKLKFEVVYPHSPERVWQALTDPGQLSQWLMPTNLKPVPGSRFQFVAIAKGKRHSVSGEVIEAVEGKSLSYTWDDGENGSPGVVAWKLQPTDGGTKVTLEHLSATDAVDAVSMIEARTNWEFLLGRALPNCLKQPVPIVYMAEEPKQETDRRAGFRQEEVVCS